MGENFGNPLACAFAYISTQKWKAMTQARLRAPLVTELWLSTGSVVKRALPEPARRTVGCCMLAWEHGNRWGSKVGFKRHCLPFWVLMYTKAHTRDFENSLPFCSLLSYANVMRRYKNAGPNRPFQQKLIEVMNVEIHLAVVRFTNFGDPLTRSWIRGLRADSSRISLLAMDMHNFKICAYMVCSRTLPMSYDSKMTEHVAEKSGAGAS